MATVKSLALAGKTVNVPHTEHRDIDEDGEAQEKNTVTFDEKGKAKVSDVLADALVEFYPSQVERVS